MYISIIKPWAIVEYACHIVILIQEFKMIRIQQCIVLVKQIVVTIIIPGETDYMPSVYYL